MLRRIKKDIKEIKESNLEKLGIYCYYDENNIKNAKALIIGPSDTPYNKGSYMFDINFPEQYPLEPPKVKFISYTHKIRFNPNLYTGGKVCLSIINTWSGPKWSSALTPVSVLISIQSLMNNNPMENEPGHEGRKNKETEDYKRYVEYGNVCVATIDTYNKLPEGFEIFKKFIAENIYKNKEYFFEYFEKNKDEETISTYFNTLKTQRGIYKEKFKKIIVELEKDKVLMDKIKKEKEEEKEIQK